MLGDTTSSATHIKESFSHGSVPPITLVNRALIELHQNDATAALADVQKAIRQDSYLKEAFETRAMIYDKLSRPEAATADRKAAAKMLYHLD